MKGSPQGTYHGKPHRNWKTKIICICKDNNVQCRSALAIFYIRSTEYQEHSNSFPASYREAVL